MTITRPPKPSALVASSPSMTTFLLSGATSARSSTGLPAMVCTDPRWECSSGRSSVTVSPETPVMVPSSAWWGS